MSALQVPNFGPKNRSSLRRTSAAFCAYEAFYAASVSLTPKAGLSDLAGLRLVGPL